MGKRRRKSGQESAHEGSGPADLRSCSPGAPALVLNTFLDHMISAASADGAHPLSAACGSEQRDSFPCSFLSVDSAWECHQLSSWPVSG